MLIFDVLIILAGIYPYRCGKEDILGCLLQVIGGALWVNILMH